MRKTGNVACTGNKSAIHTHLLTPRSRVLLEKLTGFELVKKFPAFHRTPKVHYRIHKCPPPVLILSQIKPVHTPTSQFLKIHLTIFLLNTTGCSKWSLSLTFLDQNPVYTSPLLNTCYMLLPSHSSRSDCPNNILSPIHTAVYPRILNE